VEERLAGETQRIVASTWLPLRGQYTLAGPAALHRGLARVSRLPAGEDTPAGTKNAPL
jgi:hypothetical protein